MPINYIITLKKGFKLCLNIKASKKDYQVH